MRAYMHVCVCVRICYDAPVCVHEDVVFLSRVAFLLRRARIFAIFFPKKGAQRARVYCARAF